LGFWLVRPGLEIRREIVAFRNWLLNEMSQLSWSGHSAKAGLQAVQPATS
jgi:hypothetical protein